MFLFDDRKEVKRTIRIRDEWGEMHDAEISTTQHPRLSDLELARQLGTSITTVLTHRRD